MAAGFALGSGWTDAMAEVVSSGGAEGRGGLT